MKRNILQIPIKSGLRKKAENKADELGFSSVQEMIRVMLTQMMKKDSGFEIELGSLCDKYGVNYLGLFGSIARGEAKVDSDVDLLVKFDKNKKIGLFELDSLQSELEKKLNKKVDLVTKLNKYIEPYVVKDLKTLYEKKQ